MEVNYSASPDQWPAPSLYENFDLPLTPLQLAPLCVGAAGVLLTCVLFVLQTAAVCRGMRNARAKTRIIFLIGFLPFTAAVSLVAMVMPRTIPMCNLVIAFYYARCLFAFVEVISTDIHGDRKLLKMAVAGARARLNVLPFCCCVCLPMPLANGRLLQRVEWLAWQNGLVRVLIMFVISAVSANRVGAPHDTPRPLISFMAVLGVVSTLTAVWALRVYERIVASNMTAYRALLYCKLMTVLVAAVNFLPNLAILLGYSLAIIPHVQHQNGYVVAQIGSFLSLIIAVCGISVVLCVLARPSRNRLLRSPSTGSLAVSNAQSQTHSCATNAVSIAGGNGPAYVNRAADLPQIVVQLGDGQQCQCQCQAHKLADAGGEQGGGQAAQEAAKPHHN